MAVARPGLEQTASPGDAMTIAEFKAFLEDRPDEERWELIEGEPILNATPVVRHQIVVMRLLVLLDAARLASGAGWIAIPGVGARVSDISAPVPDVMVRPMSGLDSWLFDDMIVAFEILSPSTRGRDRNWKRRAYQSLPSLAHYVIVAPDRIDVVSHDRVGGFTGRRLTDPTNTLDLPALGVSLSLAGIYRDVAGLD